MEINVSNMAINTLYRFDTNKYVWTTKLSETRGGTHKEGGSFDVTEVYEITNEGYIKLVASGKLNVNPNNNEFEIFDYDKETTTSFKVTMHMQQVSLNELHEIRDAVARNYSKANK